MADSEGIHEQILETASESADMIVRMIAAANGFQVDEEETEGCTRYTEEAQEVFNKWYDLIDNALHDSINCDCDRK
jgi:hypothetical protein